MIQHQARYGAPGVAELIRNASSSLMESSSKYSSASSKVEAFNDMVVELVQGLCRQKEIEIQKEREELIERTKAEIMARQVAQIHDNYHSTITKFETISQDIEKMSQKTREISSLEHDSSSKLGLRFDNSENIEMQNTYDEIQAIIDRYGLPQIWNPDFKFGPECYVEVQMWTDRGLEKFMK